MVDTSLSVVELFMAFKYNQVKKESRGEIMLNRMSKILTIIMGCLIAAFIGYGLYKYWDYQTHPDLYAVQSAPWYTSLMIYGVGLLVVLVICAILKVALRVKMRR